MNINAAIIDQRARALAQAQHDDLPEKVKNGDDKGRISYAFVLLTVMLDLRIDEDEAMLYMVDGGNDFGCDALHTSEPKDGEFAVTFYQGKYKHPKDDGSGLEGGNNFPENEIKKVIQSIGGLFDPARKVVLNEKLQAKVTAIRTLINDGFIPQIRVVLCSNGQRRNTIDQGIIDESGLGPQVTWDYHNHDTLVALLQATKDPDEKLPLTGLALVENFDFRRVLVGRMAVSEISDLMERNGDLLLERNIRRYLGTGGANSVNKRVLETLESDAERRNFFFYNNGITMVCSQLAYNALQRENWLVSAKKLQIINGGQTCKTIASAVRRAKDSGRQIDWAQATVQVRLYELPETTEADAAERLINNITFATNSQNPVDLQDLRSNDAVQKRLESSVESLGGCYRRQRSVAQVKGEISCRVAAEAVLAIWRRLPHVAEHQKTEHFGRHYDTIFSPDLNGAQLLLAVSILKQTQREVEQIQAGRLPWFHYASHFLAMLIGKQLTAEAGEVAKITHLNYHRLLQSLETHFGTWFREAVKTTSAALSLLYGQPEPALSRCARAFRSGELVEVLAEM